MSHFITRKDQLGSEENRIIHVAQLSHFKNMHTLVTAQIYFAQLKTSLKQFGKLGNDITYSRITFKFRNIKKKIPLLSRVRGKVFCNKKQFLKVLYQGTKWPIQIYKMTIIILTILFLSNKQSFGMRKKEKRNAFNWSQNMTDLMYFFFTFLVSKIEDPTWKKIY